MDTSNPSALIRALLPKAPLILKTALFHTLSLSPTSSKWDLRTELIISVLRSFFTGPPSPLSKTQHISLRDPGIKGPMWISKVTLPRPEGDDVREAIVRAIEGLKEGGETYTLPELKAVEAEWTGYRAGLDANAAELDISEGEKYEHLMKEVKSDVTILYFHGGAYYLMDPASHRPTTSRLAKQTSGRVLSVRYRLAPQNPFPAALLDALTAYLSLLSPPPNAPHAAIPASQIVFAGDSAGANLSLSLLQLLLELRRHSPAPRIKWHGGAMIDIPLPAGLALNSPWTDLTRCMPSLVANAVYDYLPPLSAGTDHLPPCPIWPTVPPRGDVYCDTSALCHPLVSPLAARDWRGACPVWMGCGQEMLYDEAALLAARMAGQGVCVGWACFEAMPHCFALMMDLLPGSGRCFEGWAEWVRGCVEGRGKVVARGVFVEVGGREREVDVRGLGEEVGVGGFEEVLGRMREARGKRARGEEGEAKVLPKL